MSFNIDDSRGRQYQETIELVAEQLSSHLRKAVSETRVNGKDFSVDRVADPNDTLAVVTSRHMDTEVSDMTHSRRVGTLKSFARAVMIDDEDKIRLLADPTSPYLRELGGQFNRTLDDDIITQMLGDAATGETGSGTQALPAGQQIAHGTAGLTLNKLKEARKILLANNVDLDREDLFLAYNAEGWEDLITDSGVISRDFIMAEPNKDGRLPMLAGFQLVPAERLSTYTGTSAASTNRPAIAFTRSALRLGIGADMKLSVKERADKNDNVQALLKATFGSVRVHDEKVVDIRFQE